MSQQPNIERERFINEQGGFGTYGPGYPQRVRKSKANQVKWGLGYFVGAAALVWAGYTSLAVPVAGLGVVTLVIAWALGGGRSEWLRWGLVLALVGFGGWYLLQALPVVMASLMMGG